MMDLLRRTVFPGFVLLFAGYAAGAGLAWESGSDGLAPVPALKQRVTDLTDTLAAPAVQTLETRLASWEAATGNQLVVLIVPSTKPEPIEAYSIRVAEAWKIGRKGQDNGALLVVAKDDKKLRIEVGYGFEGVLTDVAARRIIAEDIVPSFQVGNFADGIDKGVARIIATVDQGGLSASASPSASATKSKSSKGVSGFSLEMLLVVVFIVVPVLASILRRIFGRALGSAVGAGIIGAGAWVVTGVLFVAILAALIALVVILVSSTGGGLSRRGGGVWTSSGGGGGWDGGGGGGGGFSGGGGSFGGGGASGGWN